MGDNQYPNPNQSIEQIMQSPRQGGNFAGRPPMRPNGNNNPSMNNPSLMQMRAFQQAQMAMMGQGSFVRPNPFQAQQMSMMNMGRGPVNQFPQPVNGMINNQNFQTPPGMMNMGMGQPSQMASQPPHQPANGTPQPVPQPGSRLPPTPSTPAPPLAAIDSSIPKSSHPPSRAASIPPARQISAGDTDFHEEEQDLEDSQGDRLFRECLNGFLVSDQELSDINHWIRLVNKYFSPKARYRHQYLGSGANSRTHEFHSDFYMLPYMLQSSFTADSTRTKFILSQPNFQRNGSYLRISYNKSEIINQHPQTWTFSEVSISIVFEGDGKMLAWNFITKSCQEYISRTSIEQYITSKKSNSNSSGSTDTSIQVSEFNTKFPPHVTDSSASRKLIDKLEILSSTSLLTPLVEIQCTLKRPISACCDMYFKDFGQAAKGSLPSSHSTPILPTSRVTPKPRAAPSSTSAAQSVMSPLNPARQLTNGSTMSLDSPSSQPDSSQPSFSLTPLQTTSELVDSGAPAKKGRGGSTAKGTARKGRTAGTSTRARKSSTSSKTPKTEDG